MNILRKRKNTFRLFCPSSEIFLFCCEVWPFNVRVCGHICGSVLWTAAAVSLFCCCDLICVCSDVNPAMFRWCHVHFFMQGLKNQCGIKLNIVRCPPVTTVLIRRPDLRYQLGFSVQNGIVGDTELCLYSVRSLFYLWSKLTHLSINRSAALCVGASLRGAGSEWDTASSRSTARAWWPRPMRRSSTSCPTLWERWDVPLHSDITNTEL